MLYDGEELSVFGGRFCTADVVTWSLEPGEIWTESMPWSAEYFDSYSHVPWKLPAGEYELTPIAGNVRGAPITVEIVD